jgi:hypothetical protein
MNRVGAASLRLMAVGIPFFLTACSSTPSNPALNLAGTWTVTAVSTQSHTNLSGSAAISQSGQGLGVNGATTLNATIGQIAVSQTGTTFTGTIANSMQKVAYNFTGTLSGGNLTITGSTPCLPSNAMQVTSFTGTITSNAIQGNYTIAHGSGCYYAGDAGTFAATKQ